MRKCFNESSFDVKSDVENQANIMSNTFYLRMHLGDFFPFGGLAY